MRALRVLWRTLGGLWAVATMLVLAGSLALNLTMAVVPAVAAAVGAAVSTVTGVRSVAARQASRVAALEAKAVAAAAEARTARLAADAAAAEARAARTVMYRGARTTAARAVADTTDRVARRTAGMAARSVASAAGEALPVVGIGVIAAATAWELDQACDLMADMREMDVALNPERAVAPGHAEVCGLQAPTRAEIRAAVAGSPGAAWEAARGFYAELPELSFGAVWSTLSAPFRAAYGWAFPEDAP